MSTSAPSPPLPDPRRFQAELEFLSELCQVVTTATELKPILDWIVQKTTAMLEAEEGSIKLLGSEPAPMFHTMIRQRPKNVDPHQFALETSVTGWILSRGEPLSSPDLLADPRFPGLHGAPMRVRSILAAPLRVGNRITGILAVTHREPGRHWTPFDVQLLSIIGAHSASVLENARLREVEEEKRRLEQELWVARDTQMGLVPSRPMIFGPWEIRGKVIPARAVGGDYFDYYPLSDQRFAVAIADVSGKGMPAALLMSNVQAALRAHATEERKARDAVRQVNAQVARSAGLGKFVTLFYGQVDVPGGTLTYTNAGHNLPLLRRSSGQVEELSAGGLLLGVEEDAQYEQETVPFRPNDALLLYSDGISEASDSRGNHFGEERLRQWWLAWEQQTPDSVLETLVKELETFRGAAAQSDDITAVVVSAHSQA